MAIGWLATLDPDIGQRHSYRLLSNPGGRFRLSGTEVQVAVSNTLCLAEGGAYCLLNYEKKIKTNVTIRSSDNGSPSLYNDQSFAIHLRDVNDGPRNLNLSGNHTVKENSPMGTLVGTFSALDEDSGQTLSCTLLESGGGKFGIQNGNWLIVKCTVDYE